jgi:hypothetical protein
MVDMQRLIKECQEIIKKAQETKPKPVTMPSDGEIISSGKKK